MSKSNRPKHTPKQLAEWREARVIHYTDTRSIDALARMVVELEDTHNVIPEFEIDEEWPESVRSMRRSK